jgi:hypothetical protein
MVNPKISKALQGAAWVLVGLEAAKTVWRKTPLKASHYLEKTKDEKSATKQKSGSTLDSFSKSDAQSL